MCCPSGGRWPLGLTDVVSVRLWLDRYVEVSDPANVFSRFAQVLDPLFARCRTRSNALGGGDPGLRGGHSILAIAALSDQEINTLPRSCCPAAPSFGLPGAG